MASIFFENYSFDYIKGKKDDGSAYKYKTMFYKYIFYADTIEELAAAVKSVYSIAKIIKVCTYNKKKGEYINGNRYGTRIDDLKCVIPTSKKKGELSRYKSYEIDGKEYYVMKVSKARRKGSLDDIICYIVEDTDKNILLFTQNDINDKNVNELEEDIYE